MLSKRHCLRDILTWQSRPRWKFTKIRLEFGCAAGRKPKSWQKSGDPGRHPESRKNHESPGAGVPRKRPDSRKDPGSRPESRQVFGPAKKTTSAPGGINQLIREKSGQAENTMKGVGVRQPKNRQVFGSSRIAKKNHLGNPGLEAEKPGRKSSNCGGFGGREKDYGRENGPGGVERKKPSKTARSGAGPRNPKKHRAAELKNTSSSPEMVFLILTRREGRRAEKDRRRSRRSRRSGGMGRSGREDYAPSRRRTRAARSRRAPALPPPRSSVFLPRQAAHRRAAARDDSSSWCFCSWPR